MMKRRLSDQIDLQCLVKRWWSEQITPTHFGALEWLEIKDDSLLERFCLHFTSLQTMLIRIDSSFVKHLSCLSLLKQLNTLRLYLANFDPIEATSQPQLNIVPFESLGTLYVSLNHKPHKALKLLDSINFAHLFPNLKYCHLHWYYGQFVVELQAKAKQRVKEHYESMIRPVTRCKQLLYVEYSSMDHYYRWTRELTHHHIEFIGFDYIAP